MLLGLTFHINSKLDECCEGTLFVIVQGRGQVLIQLTKIDKSAILINIEAIKYIEPVPDTLILFLNGDSVIVTETLEEIIDKFEHRKSQIIKRVNLKEESDHDYSS